MYQIYLNFLDELLFRLMTYFGCYIPNTKDMDSEITVSLCGLNKGFSLKFTENCCDFHLPEIKRLYVFILVIICNVIHIYVQA